MVVAPCDGCLSECKQLKQTSTAQLKSTIMPHRWRLHGVPFPPHRTYWSRAKIHACTAVLTMAMALVSSTANNFLRHAYGWLEQYVEGLTNGSHFTQACVMRKKASAKAPANFSKVLRPAVKDGSVERDRICEVRLSSNGLAPE